MDAAESRGFRGRGSRGDRLALFTPDRDSHYVLLDHLSQSDASIMTGREDVALLVRHGYVDSDPRVFRGDVARSSPERNVSAIEDAAILSVPLGRLSAPIASSVVAISDSGDDSASRSRSPASVDRTDRVVRITRAVP